MSAAATKAHVGLCANRLVLGVLWMVGGMLGGTGLAFAQEDQSTAAPATETMATTGSLAISAELNGALILLDGEDTGRRTPSVLKGVTPGEHVVVARSRCMGARAKVIVEAGVETSVDLAMLEGRGRLKLSTHPRQAAIVVDGVEIGNAPIISDPLKCGEHVVEAYALGHEPVSRIVDIPAFTKRRIHLTLAPLPEGALAESLVGATGIQRPGVPGKTDEPVEAASEEEAAEQAPAEDAGSADEAPAEEAGSADAPAEEAPAEEAGSADATAEEAPVEEAGSADATAEEAPVEEAGSADAPAEEAPAEETSALGAASAEASAEEAPAVDGAPAAADAPVAEAPDGAVEGTTTPMEVSITGGESEPGLTDTQLYVGGTLVVGLGLGTAGVLQHRKANEAFFRYKDEPNDGVAVQIWNDEVAPYLRRTYTLYGTGALALGACTFLWIRDDVALRPGPGGLVVSGRW